MNHLYSFTNATTSPWSSVSLDLSTVTWRNGYATLSVRRGSVRLQTYYSASELRFIAAKFIEAAEALDRTARQQNEEWLDTISDGSTAQIERVFAEIDGAWRN